MCWVIGDFVGRGVFMILDFFLTANFFHNTQSFVLK